MNVPKWVKPVFVIAGLYDGILGLLFLIMPLKLFQAACVPPPNHLGYVKFPAMLLMVFGIMFFNIARNPSANKNLITYGILLKLSYCAVVFSYWFLGNIPAIWVPFAFFDLAFLVMFMAAKKAVA